MQEEYSDVKVSFHLMNYGQKHASNRVFQDVGKIHNVDTLHHKTLFPQTSNDSCTCKYRVVQYSDIK